MSLPSGYKRLEYIQSTGTQYIDTGFTANQNTSATIKFSTTQQSGGGILVAMQGWKNRGFGIFVNAIIFGSSTADRNGMFGDGNIHEVTLTSAQCYDNGSLIWSGTASTFTTPATLTICKSNVVSEPHEFSSAKIYSCQIYDNGSLVRDYVPCINNDGTIGLWDDVNSVFYGNSGTGTFAAGPVIAIAADESEITKLEYIQSTGTQYIDTGFKPNQNTRVLCEFLTKSSNTSLFGSQEAWGSKSYSFGSNTASFGANWTTSLSFNDGVKHIVDFKNNSISVDDNVLLNYSGTFQINYDMYVLANNEKDTTVYYSSAKLYSCKIYDNGTMIRDYIAAKLSDGTVGLYDKLNGLLYINAGTDVFEAGPSSLNLPVNIGGTWKDANEAFVNIGGTWKTVEAAFVNIDGTWKELS